MPSKTKSVNTKANSIFDNPLHFVISIIILFLVMVVIYIFIRLIQQTMKQNQMIKKYEIVMPRQGDGRNFIKCPIGCHRGVCVDKNKEGKIGFCQFDFQCQYCEDGATGQFYVGGNYENEKKIIPTYEQKVVRDDDMDRLNKDIETNNEYVKKLNEEIQKENDRAMASYRL
jgi:hypothetical protein